MSRLMPGSWAHLGLQMLQSFVSAGNVTAGLSKELTHGVFCNGATQLWTLVPHIWDQTQYVAQFTLQTTTFDAYRQHAEGDSTHAAVVNPFLKSVKAAGATHGAHTWNTRHSSSHCRDSLVTRNAQGPGLLGRAIDEAESRYSLGIRTRGFVANLTVGDNSAHERRCLVLQCR